MYLKQNLDEVNSHLDDVSIRAEICSSEQLSRMVHEHSVDLALTTVPFKSDDVETIELNESFLSLYSPAELAEHATSHLYVALDWGRKTNEMLEKRFPEIKKATIRTGSLQVALNYLVSNKSAIILPTDIGQSLVEDGDLVEIETLAPISVKCYLVYLKESKNAGLGKFIELFKQDLKRKQG
jgi:DNA-binding transcriptional LysR family regulator